MRGTSVLAFMLVCIACTANASDSDLQCTIADDCQAAINRKYECEAGRCIRQNYSYRGAIEIIGIIAVMVVSAISNTGGVGAGTVIVPVYSVLLSFTSSDSVHLSRITILASALVNIAVNYRKRDAKQSDRFLIDYSLAAVMIPLHLAGAEVGVMLGKLLPTIGITVFLFFVLILAVYKTHIRANEETKKESLMINKDKRSALDREKSKNEDMNTLTELENLPQIDGDGRSEDVEAVTQRAREAQEDNLKPVSLELVVSAPPVDYYNENYESLSTGYLFKQQYVNFLIMIASLSSVLMSALLRGGDGRPSIIGLQVCSTITNRIVLASQMTTFLLAILSYMYNNQSLIKQSIESLSLERDKYIRTRLIVASYLTGMAAGVVGVGGGMMLSIYMLSFGLDVVASGVQATFLILFSSTSTSVQSIIAGGIHMRHVYVIMMMSLIGSIIGNCFIKKQIQKHNKQSIVLWILLGVLILALIVIPYQGVTDIIKNPKASLSLGQFC